MNLLDAIIRLDKEEQNRKADYTIWGFLYQFNLVLLDILNEGTDEDVFCDGEKDDECNYQIEVIEDYIKYFEKNDKYHIRLVQVKYNSKSEEFDNWNVLLDLYYNYLQLKGYSSDDFDFKACILYHTKSNIRIDEEEIVSKGNTVIDRYINAIEEIASTKVGEVSKLGKHILENKSKQNQLSRQTKCLEELHTSKDKEYFLKNAVSIKWKDNLEGVISEIKEKLNCAFSNILTEYDTEKRKDIIYSVAINYIYSKWQRKNDRLDEVIIKPSQFYSYIKDAATNKAVPYNYLISNIMNIVKIIEDEIADEMIEEGYDDWEVGGVLSKYYSDIFIEVIKFFNKKLVDKINRFKLLNTVMANFDKDYISYDKLSEIDEINEFGRAYQFLFGYIKRLVKFIKNSGCKVEESLDFETEIIQFKNKNEKRECVLLPNSTNLRPLSVHKKVLAKLKANNQSPSVWYFDKVNVPNRRYEVNIVHPTLDNKVNINLPQRNEYFIECMDCLDESSYFKEDNIHCIYKEECRLNGQKKNS
ncbi:MAG: hypothetical protein E6344_18720 [Clostridium sp.]|nr:hypothetical protein [Clostridium sp.]MDU7085731.1 hypothetical protein [Clostridium sp.]